MIVFSSMEAARQAGFRWHSFSVSYRLHVVESDRKTPRGRVRSLAFACPTPQEMEELGVSSDLVYSAATSDS